MIPLTTPVASSSEKTQQYQWLPDQDLNLDKQIQSLLCYHYTIRQAVQISWKEYLTGMSDYKNNQLAPVALR
jgi:hypothetical protein